MADDPLAAWEGAGEVPTPGATEALVRPSGGTDAARSALADAGADADAGDADPADAARGPVDEVVVLERWRGRWATDDPDAAFKQEVAAYTLLDPLHTLRGMSANLDIPVGALARYVLARWASAGNEGLLHLGGSVVARMWATCEAAEAAGSDAARLEAYATLRHMVSWLRVPLDQPEAS